MGAILVVGNVTRASALRRNMLKDFLDAGRISYLTKETTLNMTDALKSHFLNLYAMALTDSQFDEREIYLLYKLSQNRGISRIDLDNLLLNPATVKFHFPETLSERIEYLYDYAKMILADDLIEEEELRTLQKFCVRLGFKETNTQSITDLLLDAARQNVPSIEIIKFVTENVT